MKVSIQDKEALAAVSPAALSAYARADGWTRGEPYGQHSDVYTRDGAPEIIVPRTQRLGDYVSVVSRLIEIFAEVAEKDALSLYRVLMTVDRDVVRVRAATGDGNSSVSLNAGVNLITGARDLVLAAARSLHEPRLAYRGAPYRETREYLRQVQLGQTEQGGFVTLLGPVIPPPEQKEAKLHSGADDCPVGRQMTERLVEALTAARKAVDNAFDGDEKISFDEDNRTFLSAVNHGVSANLCDALAMLIEPFQGIDVALSWARTRPMKKAHESVHFSTSDARVLHEAARRFREQKPKPVPEAKPDISLTGYIRRLQRDDPEAVGNVIVVDEDGRSISADLNPLDYERALWAHRNDAHVVMNGDLEVSGAMWRLRNPRIVKFISDENAALSETVLAGESRRGGTVARQSRNKRT